MTEKPAGIIGTGISDLVEGFCDQMNGHRTRIFEISNKLFATTVP